MYRSSLRSAITGLSRATPKQLTARRFVSTAPPHQKSRSFRSSALRWGLAGALVYYYNTSSVFADEPAYALHAPPATSIESETYPTIEAAAEQRRLQAKSQAPSPTPSTQNATTAVAAPDASGALEGSPEGLEEEASQQGAFNEETGEINWDCPCLGGMAHGPCGDQFRAAFSCFVYSKEEPKGVDCIEHFKTMQNCFRDHPEVYGAELEDDDVPPEGLDGEPAPVSSQPTPVSASEPASAPPSLAQMDSPHGRGEKVAENINAKPDADHVVAEKRERAEAATQQVKSEHGAVSESSEAMPKAWHDGR